MSCTTNDNTASIDRQVKKSDPLNPLHLGRVFVQRQGDNFAEATYMAKMPKPGKGRQEAMHDTKQAAHLRRAMSRLKGYIRTNFGQDSEREAHITLNYRGTMNDKDRLYADFKRFMQQLRYWYPLHTFEYIAIMEPHEKGGWHIHMLLKSDLPLWHSNGVVGLCYDKVRDLWRKANRTGEGGSYHARLPDDVADYGTYFAAYFTTMIPEDVELSGDRDAIKAASKAAVKGSRLRFYPSNFKFYRTSAGIEKPKKSLEDCGSVVREFGSPRLTRAYSVHDMVDGKVDNDNPRQFVQCMDFRRG